MQNLVHKYNLFFLFISIIWQPMQLFLLHVDAAGRTTLILSLIAVFFNIPLLNKYKNVILSPSFICWTLLVVYSFANSMNKGFEEEHGAFYFTRVNFISPYIFLLVATIELAENHIRFLKVMVIGFLSYFMIGIPHLEVGRENRIEVQALGNIFALQAATAIFIACVLVCYQKLNKIVLFSLVVLALYIVIVSGARKALGASAILIVGWLLATNSSFSIKSVLRIVIFGIAIYWGITYLLEHTVLGDRMIETEENVENIVFTSNEKINSIILFAVGDRGSMYMTGYELFLNNKWTGIGIGNYQVASFSELRLHSEYMVQLCENGLVGMGLFFLTYFLMLKQMIARIRRKDKYVIMGFFGFLTLMFLNITTWTYSLDFAMIIYALSFNFSYNKKMQLT